MEARGLMSGSTAPRGATLLSAVRGRLRYPPTAFAVGAVIVGVLIRLWVLRTAAFDGDQAVTGIMVRRILSGRDQYLYFAGQSYNGSLEQYVQATIYAIFPLPRNPYTLRLAEVLLMAVAIWMMYIVGRRVLRRDWPAAISAGLLAVGPFFTVMRGLNSGGAYAVLLPVGLSTVFCAVRLKETDSSSDNKVTGVGWAAGFGASTGLFAWLGLSGIELVVPAAIIAAPVLIRKWELLLPAVAGVVAGSAPMWLWAWTHSSFALANFGPAVQATTASQRLQFLLGPVIREFVGVAGYNGSPGWPSHLQDVLVWGLAATFLTACWRRRRGLSALLTLRKVGWLPLDALLLSVPVVGALFVQSKWAWVTAEPRYLFVYSPVLLWLLAAMVPAQPRSAQKALVVAGCTVLTATSLTMLWNRHQPRFDDSADMRAAVQLLAAAHETTGYADYWTAMPAEYFGGSNFDIASYNTGLFKFPDVVTAAENAPATVYLQGIPDPYGRPSGVDVEAALRAHDIKFRRTVFGRITVLDRLSDNVKPWDLGIGAQPEFPD